MMGIARGADIGNRLGAKMRPHRRAVRTGLGRFPHVVATAASLRTHRHVIVHSQFFKSLKQWLLTSNPIDVCFVASESLQLQNRHW